MISNKLNIRLAKVNTFLKLYSFGHLKRFLQTAFSISRVKILRTAIKSFVAILKAEFRGPNKRLFGPYIIQACFAGTLLEKDHRLTPRYMRAQAEDSERHNMETFYVNIQLMIPFC